MFIAELLRAEGARTKHPFFRNFGTLSSRVNLVMTSPFVQTLRGGEAGRGRGGLEAQPIMHRE